MGEIKSTLDLAMERANKMDILPKEIEDIKKNEYLKISQGIVNRYLNSEFHIHKFTKEINKYNENERKILEESLFLEFVNALSLSIDNTRLFEAIEALNQGNVTPILEKIDTLCRDFSEEKKSRQNEAENEIKKRLGTIGISGTSVRPRIHSWKEWNDALDSLVSEYDAKLLQYKAELLIKDED